VGKLNNEKVTLVTEAQAKKGVILIAKPLPSCVKCKLYKVCMGNLRPYARYEVVKVRRISHVCPLTGSPMRVAIVRELPVKVAIASHKAVEGAIVSYSPPNCNVGNCKYRELCFPKALRRRDKGVVKDILDITINCPEGRDLKVILFLPLGR